MTEISFRLIREKNPDLDFDNIDTITCITLNNCSIQNIDNLELFSHAKEIHLAHNNIEKIENIFFFDKLEFLNISFNKVSSDGLLSSLGGIPKALQALNLSGNPCAQDEEILTKLQDKYPNLGIIIDEVDDLEGDENMLERREDAEDGEMSVGETLIMDSFRATVGYDGSKPLNSDEILKAIVERKSKLQSFIPFNVDAAVKDLDREYDDAISSGEGLRSSRRERIRNCSASSIENKDELAASFASRTQSLKDRNEEARAQSVTKFDELMKRLKTTAATTRQNILAERNTIVEGDSIDSSDTGNRKRDPPQEKKLRIHDGNSPAFTAAADGKVGPAAGSESKNSST